MAKKCNICGARSYSDYCFIHKPRKAIKRIKRPIQQGKEYERYKKFRDEVAIPYLDKNFGHKCRCCGTAERLDVDHIHSRGSRPELKYQLSNLQWLCRSPCHRNKTDGIECLHFV